ncbi:cupin domain-containing protein [Pseudalkalibacillus hwajinpoensis]|uniref:cupin domain-containing protein n=1 Tax=Guptibacillus hwajinpoensis TaxID=208199 RepID=UPI00325B1D58
MNKTNVEKLFFTDHGAIPNNPDLPLVLYRGILSGYIESCAEQFAINNWTNSWKNGVFDYHHYHSNTHEVLGIVGGTAVITFGGEQGEAVEVNKGDVVVIPAGVGHKKERGSADFKVVGAYPNGMDHDLKTGKPEERPKVIENIQNVPSPDKDPILGRNGPLIEIWSHVNRN